TRLADVAGAALAMGADGKAVRLVAQPLDEIEDGVARRQLERGAIRQMEGLVTGIALRPFGDRDERHVAETEVCQRLAGGRQLALSAVDQDQVRPRRLAVVGNRLRCFRAAGNRRLPRWVGRE